MTQQTIKHTLFCHKKTNRAISCWSEKFPSCPGLPTKDLHFLNFEYIVDKVGYYQILPIWYVLKGFHMFSQTRLLVGDIEREPSFKGENASNLSAPGCNFLHRWATLWTPIVRLQWLARELVNFHKWLKRNIGKDNTYEYGRISI